MKNPLSYCQTNFPNAEKREVSIKVYVYEKKLDIFWGGDIIYHVGEKINQPNLKSNLRRGISEIFPI